MSYSSYPFSELLKETFCKKRVLLEDKGYYKTMAGSYSNGRGRYIPKYIIRRLSYRQLKLYLEEK